MLILTRKPGESIKIGEDIYITLLATKGNQSRIGIEAPRELDVVRTELLPNGEQKHAMLSPKENHGNT